MIDRWATPVWRAADGSTESLKRVPASQQPFKEATLRDLLASTPSLLPVNRFDPVFSSPVCLGTEFRVPGVGRVDALFLSATGYITIVETKLWRNSEARREVVAQIIDYAKELARWTYSDLEKGFKDKRSATDGDGSLFSHVCEEEDDPADQAEFVDAVNRCLRNGRFLLLVIGDGIREGVEEMAEFLQRTPTLQYTLGLVELACYQRRDDADSLLFVPQVVTRTAEVTRAVVHIDLNESARNTVAVSAEVPKTTTSSSEKKNPLSEEEFYELLKGSTSHEVARQLRTFVDGLSDREELIEVSFTPIRLLLKMQLPSADGAQPVILSVSKGGKIRTSKRWLDFLREDHSTELLEEFIAGLVAIDRFSS